MNKKIIIISAGALAVMALIILGGKACSDKIDKDRQEKYNRAVVNLEKLREMYLLAEKNIMAVTASLKQTLSYIQEHPEIIEDLKKFDWTDLKQYESDKRLNELYKIGLRSVKRHFKEGTVIELYKQLIPENERITVFMEHAFWGLQYEDCLHLRLDIFYLRQRSFVVFVHDLSTMIMSKVGHNPFEVTK